MNSILSDQKKFTMVNLRDNILLNIAVNQEKQVDKVLKKLFQHNSMIENTRKSLKPVTDQVLCTVHVRYIKQAWTSARHFDQFGGFKYSHQQT